jgi:PKD repeat protein
MKTTKMKGADAFERSLQEALDHYEVPYNSTDWAQLEKRLDGQKSYSWTSSAGLYALFLGGAIAVATVVYVMLAQEPGMPGNGSGNGLALVINDEDTSSGEESASMPVTEGTTEASIDSPAPEVEVEDNRIATTISTSKKASGTSSSMKSTNVRSASVVTAEMNAGPVMGTKEADDDGAKAASKAIAIKSSITEGCPGTTIDFSADNLPEGGMHLWNFGDGNFSNKPAPTHTYSKAGTFEVMLSHSSMGGGSIRNKPASDRIVIHEAPDANFKFLKQEYDALVPYVHFENRSNGGSRYEWDFGDGSNSEIAHPDHVYKKKGTYQVMLTVTNGKGCIDRTERTIVIDNDYNLLAPTSFSPDGNGFEDTFIPEALKTLGARFHMTIYSQSGDLIYETFDPLRPWNGKVGNKGDLCATGDYVWLVEMKDGDRLGGTYTGNVSLVR